jgi:predicted phage terminase large subunit-like protein
MATAAIRWPAVAHASTLETAHHEARARVTAVRPDGLASGPLRPWLQTVSPRMRWDWRHLVYVQDALGRVTSGTTKRLMLFLPPRHGKSELATVRYPVYRLERDPETRVIIGAYNATLARKFSRKARRIARERLALSDDRTAVEDWETTRGGGVRAVGVGDGVTGQGGDLIIIDDPVKSREEAESETYRDRVWEWYTDDLYTRLEPGGAIVLIMTRWHEDDLAGRILQSEDAASWEVISLPALAESDDPLGRQPGEALCPDRFDEAALADIRRVTLGFDALYQQRPVAASGEMFDPAWFGFVEAAPLDCEWVRGWDKAATAGGGDNTASVKMGRSRSTGVYYIAHRLSVQLAPGDRDTLIRQTAVADGHAVEQVSQQDPGQAGKSDAIAFVKLLNGYRASTEPISGDKEVLAGPFASQAQIGNVKLVRGAWNRPYLEQLRQFPRGKHDDDVDASSVAFNKLARRVPRRSLPSSTSSFVMP